MHTYIRGFLTVVDCQWTCVDVSMGEKECLTLSTSILHRLLCVLYRISYRKSCLMSQVMLNKPWVALPNHGMIKYYACMRSISVFHRVAPIRQFSSLMDPRLTLYSYINADCWRLLLLLALDTLSITPILKNTLCQIAWHLQIFRA